jgi:thiol:disulfide interchange protein DsbD
VWEPYSPDRLAALRRAGRAVFVDFTAAWCLSCQVNERIALATPAVQAAFRQERVVAMKADWTNRDPAITEALAAFQRSGVPFYVLYRPRRPPQVLPELLTPDLVLAALQQANQ